MLDLLKKIIKQVFFPEEEIFSKLTPEFFHQQKRKMHPKEYLKYLKRKYKVVETIVDGRLMEGRNIPEHWIDKITLLEEEIENIAHSIGQIPFKNRKEKLSEIIKERKEKLNEIIKEIKEIIKEIKIKK